jgi:hypothetical protein
MEASGMEKSMMRNSNGAWIEVNEEGVAYCDSCTNEQHIDDMLNSKVCLICDEDLHSDDWTMEEA